jgi:uncharacterized membrane protein YphA (DoxX/SURF4 family)
MSEQTKKDIFAIVLGILFILIGIPKIAGVQGGIDNFNNWGLGDTWRYIAGTTEITLGVLMFFPSTKKYAAFAFFCVMTSAIMVHIISREYGVMLAPILFAGLTLWYLLKRGVVKFS